MEEHSVSYDKNEGYILVDCHGPYTAADFNRLTKQVIGLTKEHGCDFILVDYDDASFNLTTFETYKLPKSAFEFAGDETCIYDQKIALVASNKLEEIRFLETVALNQGHNVKLFNDQEAARDWLLGE